MKLSRAVVILAVCCLAATSAATAAEPVDQTRRPGKLVRMDAKPAMPRMLQVSSRQEPPAQQPLVEAPAAFPQDAGPAVEVPSAPNTYVESDMGGDVSVGYGGGYTGEVVGGCSTCNGGGGCAGGGCGGSYVGGGSQCPYRCCRDVWAGYCTERVRLYHEPCLFGWCCRKLAAKQACDTCGGGCGGGECATCGGGCSSGGCATCGGH